MKRKGGTRGALTHLSMQPHMSKYWPVQCASPVVSFSMRTPHAEYQGTIPHYHFSNSIIFEF